MKILKLFIFFLIPTIAIAQKNHLDSLVVQLQPNASFEQLDQVTRQLLKTPNGDTIAVRFVNQQLINAKKTADLKQEEKFTLLSASINLLNENYSLAFENCVDGLRISKNLNDSYYLSRFSDRLGLAYAYEKDANKSAGYFRQALKATVVKRDTIFVLNLYSNLETSYVGLKKLDSARFFAKLEYKLANTLKNKAAKNNAMASSLADLGEVENALNRPDSALFYYKQAVRFSDVYVYNSAAGFFEKNIAAAYLKTGQRDSAKKYALIAYQKTIADKKYEWMAEAAETLSKAYEGSDYKKSLFYYKAEINAKDTLNNGIGTKRFKAEENREKQIEEQFKKAAVAYQGKVRFYGVIIILVFVIIVSFILLAAYRKQQKGNKVLKRQKAEIEETLLKLQTTQQQLIQSEKMASLGELTAGIAHEIQNPLNFVNNFSEVNKEMLEELKAESEKPKAERDEQLEVELINDLIQNEEKINHHGKRADSIVKGMLEHSRTQGGQKEPTDLNAMADEYMRLSYHGLRAKDKLFNSELITHFDPGLPKIAVVPQDMGRILLNLFNNAFYAVNQKKKIAGENYKPTVEVETFFLPRQGVGGLKVKDNGIGIPDAIKEKIMQPFFTTKPTGEGTGLGLSLTYDMVVKGHGGSISVNTKEGEFTEMAIILPL